jgi:RNA-directed DNA polymerase
MHIEQEPREPIVARRGRWRWRDVSGSQRRTPMMNDNRKSDSCIVPEKPTNKPAPEAGAESGEGRRLVKGNELGSDKSRTPRRKEGWSVFKRIRLAAKEQRLMTSLYHVVYNEAQLRAAYYSLKRKAAAGVDGVTWAQYGEQLEENLKTLAERLARRRYRPPAVRRVYIPKPDGRERALGILAVADKVVQYVVACILTAVWEPEFLGFSYAYRPRRSVHDALDALTVGLMQRPINWVLDADIRAFFDTISHEWLKKFIEYRIGDKRLVALIEKWLRAGVMEAGTWQASEVGTPQGGLVSPVLANIYLHYVFDLWANNWRQRRARGAVIMVRYADDIVVGFEHREDAERFRQELGARLAQFALTLNEEKTRLIEFGRQAAQGRKQRGEGKPKTFNFLGFTHICGQTRKGKFQVVRKTMRKRMQAKLNELKIEFRQRMHQGLQEQGEWVAAVLRGHYQHYGVPLNSHALASFAFRVKRLWYRALRRRSQKAHTLSRAKFQRITARWTPAGSIHHPYPFARLALRYGRVLAVG